MRIISGDKKGLTLKSVPGNTTRPTSDKVKESIFNMIGPYFQGGVMLDLYAGSGAMGIESLSRGMDQAVFVDRDKKAIETIHLNLKIAKLESKGEVFRTDAQRALKAIHRKERKFDLIFLDPPYAKQQLKQEISFIDEHDLLVDGGVIVLEHTSKLSLSDHGTSYSLDREESYGDTTVTILTNRPKEEL
ncbi:16S rRNA (guanine(966)-N(2))-methyltransferase RsmD [Salipaludibacillus keqinensis]|uniref:16S rRNA (Guanine(966)-N(2))-methyltransferase RsmD n=1 Tax=Salipaludibacillus keqinensis TaxID=2045207 RepID=A0A323TD26_9BACI|nr:16S rRNA (guanine(966)-N(2))-methyltransferase RsmD [Salipaludibacillus keqinensis]PYZ93262.1 16S rRNA (guanine(966)-N(2))-methyltransferase RsmD [Salipaludibacillus keqinensis]